MKRAPSQWWDKSFNPVTGCTPVGAGCDHCHARRNMSRRLPALRGPGNDNLGPDVVLCHPERMDIPRRRTKPTVWLVSMCGDVFHAEVPFDFILGVVTHSVNPALRAHQFVILTKRWARVPEFVEWQRNEPWGAELHRPNLLFMGSVWDQASADEACAHLSRAGVRWGLHVEPMLGPVDMRKTVTNRIGSDMPRWIVVGAEQGPGARPFDLDWARSLRDQCRAASVPFWFKSDSKRAEPPADLLVRETPWES